MNNDTRIYVGAAIVALLLLGSGGVLSERVKPVFADSGGLTFEQQEQMEKIASASLFGQFRTSLSDYLYLKADRYMHRGVELRGLTEQERRLDNADKVSTNANDPVKMQHREETTVVPSRERDWRGHVGDIEREIVPYLDMSNHGHADPRQTLPLFRLMTWSNPHFVKGYLFGSTLINADAKHLDEAIAFLKEGEANNPDSFVLKTELGFLYTRRKKDYDTGMRYLIQSFQILAKKDLSTLTDDEKDAQLNTYRWATLNRREAKDYNTARRIVEAGQKLFPDDIVFRNYLKQYGNLP